MTKPATLLAEALEAWEHTRQGLVAEAESIPAESYGFRPTPESRTVAELATHVVAVGLMAAGELSRPDGDFARQSYEEHLREYASHLAADLPKEELLELLRRSGKDCRDRIAEAGELAMLQLIMRFDGKRGSRLAWLYHAVDHESYHRGQLALYARLMGQEPALTSLIRSG